MYANISTHDWSGRSGHSSGTMGSLICIYTFRTPQTSRTPPTSFPLFNPYPPPSHPPPHRTPTSPALKSTLPITPQHPLPKRSPLPAFRLRFSILAVMLGATDGSYLMRGETHARIPAPGLSLLRVSFPRLTSAFHLPASPLGGLLSDSAFGCYLFL